MKRCLLPESGSFYKTNLHVHTTLSDGDETPATVKRLYKEKGYSVVAFTDHEIMIAHPELADEDFLPLTAYEIAFAEQAPEVIRQGKKVCHMNLFAPAMDTPYSSLFTEKTVTNETAKHYITDEMRAHTHERVYSAEGINEIIEIAKKEGFLISLNHPVWSLQNYEDYKALRGLWGIEIRNTECVSVGYEDTDVPFVDLLRLGQRVFPLAVDDAHHKENFGMSFVDVKAPSLTYLHIFNALKNGDFYASWGPRIKALSIEDGILHLESTDIVAAYVVSERRITKSKLSDTPFTSCSIDIDKYLSQTVGAASSRWDFYIRLVLVDQNGNKALTRAYFLDELV